MELYMMAVKQEHEYRNSRRDWWVNVGLSFDDANKVSNADYRMSANISNGSQSKTGR